MILLVIFALIFVPFLWWKSVLRKYKSLDGIPGPKPLPILGNALEIGNTPQQILNAYIKINKEYGDISKFYVANELRVLITDPKLLEQTLSSNTHITKSYAYDLLKDWLGEGLLIQTGNKWKNRRRMITPTFHFKILEQFVEVFNACGNVLLEKLKEEVGQKSTNIYPYINLYALDVICETSMGVQVHAQQGQNVHYVQAVWGLLDIFMSRVFSVWKRFDLLFQFDTVHKTYREYLKILHGFTNKVISSRRKERMFKEEKGDDSDDGIKKKTALLDTLLESEKLHGLSTEDIRSEIDTFMFEGHDTTTSGISFALLCFAEHPDIQEKIYEEIVSVMGSNSTSEVTMQHLQETKYLEMAIKEALRIYPSVPVVERRLETDWTMENYGTFPKDVLLAFFIYGLHKNPQIYPNPEKFDPERFLPENHAERHTYAYLPFSAGPRNCIGQKFAMLAMKSAIIKVISKFKLLSVPDYKPELGLAAVLKSYNGVCIQLKLRNSNIE